ncbi:MAG: GreA/GreB family elongation factor, partial [Thermoanaerobaculia bacterium]|nr:GreA/GreB family elongation factor [Thermoanaerobaculia bacterium]
RIHGHRPSFEAFAEKVGLFRAPDQAPRTWEKVDRLLTLLAFDVGTVVEMQGKGVGRVAEVNLALESLRIDLERQAGLVVGFRAATRLLTALPPGHFLRRKLESPDELRALGEESPSELLGALLASSERPLTAGEVKEALAGLVDEKRWTSWWATARKHPRVVVAGSGRQTYHWAASSEAALATLQGSFEAAPPRERLDLFRRHAGRDPGLARAMAARIAASASAERERDPALAFESWLALERAGALPADLGWSVDDLLGPSGDPRRLLAGIEDRLLRERALTMLRERREDWTEIYRDTLSREADPRVLGLLAEGLRSAAPAERERFLDEVLNQPRRSPAAFVWLVELAAEDAELRSRNPLRLLQQILASLRDEGFAPYRARLAAMVDSGGTLPRLLSALPEEQAPQAMALLERDHALADYQRAPLLNALTLRFPALRESADSGLLYATAEAIAALREELQRLARVEIPANRKAIEEARAHGDLRENFEYKAARERHEYLNARVAALHRDLGRARPLDPAAIDTSEVRVGTRVTLRDREGGERALTILGPWDSRPEEEIVSYESDLAKRLLGRVVGTEVQIGESELTIIAIAPFR